MKHIIFGFYRMLHSSLKHPFKILQSILHVGLVFFFFLYTIFFFCSIMLFPLVLSCFLKFLFLDCSFSNEARFLCQHAGYKDISQVCSGVRVISLFKETTGGQGDAPGHQSNFQLKVPICQSRLCPLLAV